MNKEKKYKLPSPFTKKWCKALRSGKYKQTTGVLHNEEGYCVLGLVGKLCGIPSSVLIHTQRFVDLSQEYQKKIPGELNDLIDNRGIISELLFLNDSEHYTFEELADWLEQNVEAI